MPGPPDRYEPLPGIGELPAWLWRRAGRRARVATAVLLVATAGVAVALAPQIREFNKERVEGERRERAELRERRVRALQAEQRPRTRRSGAVAPPAADPGRRLAVRARLLAEVGATILADARRRTRAGELDGLAKRVECEPFPRTVGGVPADKDLSRGRGRYACVAVTAEFERDEDSVGGVIGHPYRVLVDFATGRYTYCKTTGAPGPASDPLVTTPKACGGT